MNLEKETEELKFDLDLFKPELPELQAKCSSLTTELELEKDKAAQFCGAKENALKEYNDIRGSLLVQNEALKKEIDH
ncbi:hypothetical protein AAVH_18948 [Aphelenchoides avenae]|nr:hypothetical protein AAVH_18948 [Aphelenchus avenae]